MSINHLFQRLVSPIKKILQTIGEVLNQCPNQDDIKRLRQSPYFRNPLRAKVKKRRQSFKVKKHGLKGTRHSEVRTYNHARK
jgi:hypothetical protein